MEFNNTEVKNKKNIILLAIILLLLVMSIFFSVKYFLQAKELSRMQKELKTQQTDEKIVNFLKLFIEKVLKTDREVPFEDRLKLENAIRGINDPELLQKWEQFTSSTNEIQIQQSVKYLFEALVNKINK